LNFVNLEYDNPQLLVSLLIKLSRKFSEKNVFTQLKVLHAIHYVVQKAEIEAQREWARAIRSIRKEKDEKSGKLYFEDDAIEEAAKYVENSIELESVEIGRQYPQYLMGMLEARLIQKVGMTNESIDKLCQLYSNASSIESMCSKVATPLAEQCLEYLRVDKQWILSIVAKFAQVSYDFKTNIFK
jgi:hypothetical protein